MIHWLTINNNPSNPQQPIHSLLSASKNFIQESNRIQPTIMWTFDQQNTFNYYRDWDVSNKVDVAKCWIKNNTPFPAGSLTFPGFFCLVGSFHGTWDTPILAGSLTWVWLKFISFFYISRKWDEFYLTSSLCLGGLKQWTRSGLGRLCI